MCSHKHSPDFCLLNFFKILLCWGTVSVTQVTTAVVPETHRSHKDITNLNHHLSTYATSKLILKLQWWLWVAKQAVASGIRHFPLNKLNLTKTKQQPNKNNNKTNKDNQDILEMKERYQFMCFPHKLQYLWIHWDLNTTCLLVNSAGFTLHLSPS